MFGGKVFDGGTDGPTGVGAVPELVGGGVLVESIGGSVLPPLVGDGGNRLGTFAGGFAGPGVGSNYAKVGPGVSLVGGV